LARAIGLFEAHGGQRPRWASERKGQEGEEVKAMDGHFFEIDIACHNFPEDFATARILQIPEVDYLRYALPDKPNETYSAEEFKSLLKEKVKFARSPELVVLVVNTSSGKRVGLKFPLKWPDVLGTVVNRWAVRIPVPEEVIKK
jgi:hypothetical protein